MIFKVPFSPKPSVILWFYDNLELNVRKWAKRDPQPQIHHWQDRSTPTVQAGNQKAAALSPLLCPPPPPCFFFLLCYLRQKVTIKCPFQNKSNPTALFPRCIAPSSPNHIKIFSSLFKKHKNISDSEHSSPCQMSCQVGHKVLDWNMPSY